MKADRVVLVVDDEDMGREGLEMALGGQGYRIVTARDGVEALEHLRAEAVDLVLTDLKMPRMGGMELLAAIRDEIGPIPVLVITAYASVETAVEAMRLGAVDYVSKPFTLADVRMKVQRAIEAADRDRENRWLRGELARLQQPGNIIGRSKAMKEILSLIAQVAPSRTNVLVTGESGTGKELIARALHFSSPWAERPFVSLNCGALPPDLLENELFGHERGAFTGAEERKPGLFEVVEGGTLFLDEIGDLPLPLQVKLLRAVQERRIRRLGGTEELDVDFRLVTATNRDLSALIEAGDFREDLYYRLNVLTIALPPLRERRDDVPILAGHFLGHFARREGKELDGFNEAALSVLESYDWPGNVRELENVVERAVILARSRKITTTALPPSLLRRKRIEELPTLEEIERQHILEVLERTGGNRSQAARILGLDRSSLWRKLKIYEGEEK